MAKKEDKRPTQIQLLEQIRDLLIPVANLSRYQIGLINENLKKQQEMAHLTQTRTAEGEMKKLESDGEKDK